MNYKDYLEDKSVALIGPAKYLENFNFGKEIDSHDIVVRINRGIELVEKIPEKVGSRSDILWSCLIEKPANAGKIDVEKLKTLGVKYICCPPKSNFAGISTSTVFHEMIDSNKMKNVNKQIPIRICEAEFHTWLAKKISSRPNTGFLSIYDFLRFDIKKLSIYGFSFYLDGFVSGVKEGIISEQNLTEDEFGTKCFNSKRHNQKNMWQFAKSNLLGDNRIHPDEVLEKILKLESLDRAKFKL
tara:strand:+ start:257 stop:982 length:726 start_codon:yes stop_codon:yes gene_type:complete